MTDKLWLRSPELETRARIVALRPVPERGLLAVLLDISCFHPQGGGQKSDRGTISGEDVLDVRHTEDGEVEHWVRAEAPFAVGQEVLLRVDPDWRRQMAALHSAGHLIAALVEARWPGLHATAGHHWPGEARVDFAGAPLPPALELGPALEQDLVDAIAEDLPIAQIGDPDHDRRIQIGDHPAVPCGGTHLQRTSELGEVALRKLKLKSGQLRIGYDVAPLTPR